MRCAASTSTSRSTCPVSGTISRTTSIAWSGRIAPAGDRLQACSALPAFFIGLWWLSSSRGRFAHRDRRRRLSAQRPRAVPARPAIPFRAGPAVRSRPPADHRTATPAFLAAARQPRLDRAALGATRSPRRSSTRSFSVGADVIPLRNGLKQARDTLAQHAFDAFRGGDHGRRRRPNRCRDRRMGASDGRIDLSSVGTCRMGADAWRWSTTSCGSAGSTGLRIVDARSCPRSSAATRTRRR